MWYRTSVWLLLALVWPTGVRGATTAEEEIFAGLPGVFVLVEALGDEIQQDGLRREQVQTDVEIRLMQSGIRVLGKERAFTIPGVPFLYLNVGTIKHGTDFYAVCVDLSLRERVRVTRKGKTFSVVGTTWRRASRVGMLSSAAIVRSIREAVEDAVDEFVTEYRASNQQ